MIQEIIAIAIATLAASYLLFRTKRAWRVGKSNCGDCSGCGTPSGQKPLVPLGGKRQG